MENTTIYSREAAFDPLNYEFDAETMVEPFTYFNDGPSESHRKIHEFSSPTLLHHLSWIPTHSNSAVSSPDENPHSYFSPTINEQHHGLLQLKSQQTTPQKQNYHHHYHHQQQQRQISAYPKTICRHCKSHNMPECLYTSHTMYDENGAIFCPVLKKCHCATCIRVINPSTVRDDDSDDDNSIRLPLGSNETSHLYGMHPRPSSYPTMNNNNF